MSNVDLTPEERARIVAERADVKYGPFASWHEAYAVLLEEWEELKDECDFSVVDIKANAIDEHMCCLWVTVKGNCATTHTVAQIREEVRTMSSRSPQAASERIDVIAVCDRIIAQWGDKP